MCEVAILNFDNTLPEMKFEIFQSHWGNGY